MANSRHPGKFEGRPISAPAEAELDVASHRRSNCIFTNLIPRRDVEVRRREISRGNPFFFLFGIYKQQWRDLKCTRGSPIFAKFINFLLNIIAFDFHLLSNGILMHSQIISNSAVALDAKRAARICSRKMLSAKILEMLRKKKSIKIYAVRRRRIVKWDMTRLRHMSQREYTAVIKDKKTRRNGVM